MKISVELRRNWGKDMFYPTSEDAKFLAEFTGRPTLLKKQLKMAVNRGWQVYITQQNYNEKILEDICTKNKQS